MISKKSVVHYVIISNITLLIAKLVSIIFGVIDATSLIDQLWGAIFVSTLTIIWILVSEG